MSLISHNELVELVEQGVIDAPLENINGTSIDITLGDKILIEKTIHINVVDLKLKHTLSTFEFDINEGYILSPNEFILATTQETFNLPNNISAEYKLKSSIARSGLQHLLAGWCDPGWSNSKLTLELKNVTQHHKLLLKPGMKIGQIVFWKCIPVPDHANYAQTGQYNDQKTVTGSKGIK